MKPTCSCNLFTIPRANASKPKTLTKANRAHSFVRMNIRSKFSRKKAVNLSVDAELLADSKALGVNLSSVLEEKLRELRLKEWKREAAPAIAQENEYIEKHGIWNAKHRPW
jgi:antitoxin CcdA